MWLVLRSITIRGGGDTDKGGNSARGGSSVSGKVERGGDKNKADEVGFI